jgi:GntR family transcriptional repressor for pyruvate dehydrogenase complex
MPAYSSDDPARLRLELEAVPAGSTASVVARQLVTLLTRGELAPGSRLPPERQLAERLGVGRSAVREALAVLEILGIVQIRPGSGTYLQGGTSELLPMTLSWGLMLAAGRTRELLEVRSGLERTTASLAASRAKPEDVAELRELVERMRASLGELEEFKDADLRFHLAVARAADNEVLADLLQAIRSLLRVWVERGLSTREQAEDAHREHSAVLRAIEAGDAAAADAAMGAHMETAAERLLGVELEGGG